jgi:hypothetical protein
VLKNLNKKLIALSVTMLMAACGTEDNPLTHRKLRSAMKTPGLGVSPKFAMAYWFTGITCTTIMAPTPG